MRSLGRPSSRVMLEGAKSAEPPMNSGSTLAMALRQSCLFRTAQKKEHFRTASLLLGVKTGRLALVLLSDLGRVLRRRQQHCKWWPCLRKRIRPVVGQLPVHHSALELRSQLRFLLLVLLNVL